MFYLAIRYRRDIVSNTGEITAQVHSLDSPTMIIGRNMVKRDNVSKQLE